MGEKLDFSHNNDRNATRKHHGRKRLKRRKGKLYLFYFLVVLIVVGISVALSLTVFFKLDTVTIIGCNEYTKQQIVDVSTVKMGENLFRIDTNLIKDKLQKQLPYVEDAQVCIRLPATLSITIQQAKAVGYFAKGNSFFVLSEKNKILQEQSTTANLNMAEINGINLKTCNIGESVVFADDNFANALLVLDQALIDNKMDKISVIDITDYLNLKVEYDHRITITFGTQVDLENKVKLTKYVLDNDISKIEMGTIDATNSKEAIFKPA